MERGGQSQCLSTVQENSGEMARGKERNTVPIHETWRPISVSFHRGEMERWQEKRRRQKNPCAWNLVQRQRRLPQRQLRLDPATLPLDN